MMAMIDMQKLEAHIYRRLLANLTERYKIINNRIVFEKDVHKNTVQDLRGRVSVYDMATPLV